MEYTDLHQSDEPMTGMLDTDSPESGDSPAMDGNGDGFLPDLPVLTPAADWSMDQVPPDTLTTVLSEDSDTSQESSDEEPQLMEETSDLGMVERAVEHFQLASAQLFQEQQQEEQVQDAVEQQMPEAARPEDQRPEECQSSVEEQSPHPTEEQPPHPTEEQPPHPTEEQPPHPTEEQPPHPTEEQPPQPTEEQPPQPTEEQPPQPTEEQPPHPAEEQPPHPTEEQPPQPAEDGSPASMELEEASKETAAETEEVAVPTEPEPEPPSEFERLFKGCEDNPEDFNGWVYLLQHVEQENQLPAVKSSFDAFFQRYPYCYGYWKKYADIEKKHGNAQVAEEVYRRGVQAIPLSVDLWLHYLAFIKENADPSDPETEGRIRAAYEHAVCAAGTDFRSDRLWEAYANWETELEQLSNVTTIYDRVLGIPTQLYSQHFQRFKDHVQNNNPKHFLTEEEFIQLRVELSKAHIAQVSEDGDGDAPTPAPAEELPPGIEDLPDPAKRVTEIENMRHKVIESRQEVFNHNEHEVSKRWTFEEGIKRPYFHVKALEKTQLSNWKEYLEFEMENGTPERVVVLFERCLIACALYEEFWTKVSLTLTPASRSPSPPNEPPTSPSTMISHPHSKSSCTLSLRVMLICDCICCIRGWPACHTRFDTSICQLLRCIFSVSHYLTETYLSGSMKYAKYLEGYSIEGMRHVYKKACTIHLTKKPNIHLLWAAFEEQQGNVDEARAILKGLEEAVPSLAMIRLRRVSLERRHGNLEEAEALLRDAMALGKNANETSFYVVKLARQLLKVQRSLGKARKVLLDAIEKDQTSPKLFLNLLELEYSGDVQQNQADILACFDRALSSQLPLESRLTFSQRKVEFLEDFGSDVNVLVAAYEEHQKLQKETDSTKRKAENGSLEPETKRQRLDENSGSGNMMPDMQGSNSAYNYNWYQQQYNNWGQNSWGQYNQYAQYNQYNQYYPPPPT